MELDEFDYQLPKSLIAQYPREDRASSRLLIFIRKEGRIIHDRFRNIPNYFRPGDVLVLNNTKVIPAKFEAKKVTGGRLDILLTGRVDERTFTCLVRNAGKKTELSAKIGETEVILKREGQEWYLYLPGGEADFQKILGQGKMPLPPYIKRPVTDVDFERYQTVYAKVEGSVAAPTAGFHFTQEILEELEKKGVLILYITLHIGMGTFLPVKTRRVEDHRMHREYFSMDESVYESLLRAKEEKRRIIACGTSTVRTLETVFTAKERVLAGYTELFIYPGYRFTVCDALITNFHLPKSTPLILVCAFAGKENVLRCYRQAIEEGYRFYSYGDSMLIL